MNLRGVIIQQNPPLSVHVVMRHFIRDQHVVVACGQRNTLLIDEGPISGHLELTIKSFPMVRWPLSITFLDQTPT